MTQVSSGIGAAETGTGSGANGAGACYLNRRTLAGGNSRKSLYSDTLRVSQRLMKDCPPFDPGRTAGLLRWRSESVTVSCAHAPIECNPSGSSGSRSRHRGQRRPSPLPHHPWSKTTVLLLEGSCRRVGRGLSDDRTPGGGRHRFRRPRAARRLGRPWPAWGLSPHPAGRRHQSRHSNVLKNVRMSHARDAGLSRDIPTFLRM